jgi:hypothetical protein
MVHVPSLHPVTPQHYPHKGCRGKDIRILYWVGDLHSWAHRFGARSANL